MTSYDRDEYLLRIEDPVRLPDVSVDAAANILMVPTVIGGAPKPVKSYLPVTLTKMQGGRRLILHTDFRHRGACPSKTCGAAGAEAR